jgi:hypothetical protein
MVNHKDSRRTHEKFSRNRISPRYINIATLQYNKLAGATAQPSPKEKKKSKEEKRKLDNVGSMKTIMIRNRCAL